MKNYETSNIHDSDFHIDQWLRIKGGSPATATAYRADIKAFIAYAETLGKTYLTVDHSDINDWVVYLKDGAAGGRAVKSEKSIARKLASVCNFYRSLNDRELIAVKLKLIGRPKVGAELKKKNIPTVKEIQAMIDHVGTQTDDGVFIRFLYRTGVRISEACDLRWVNFTEIDDGGAGIAQVVGKGEKPRDVPVAGPLWDDLKVRRATASPSDFVFPTRTPKKAYDFIIKLCRAVGIEKHITPHAFRHAFGTHSMQNGATIVDVQVAMGHSDIKTTALYLQTDLSRAPSAKLKIQ